MNTRSTISRFAVVSAAALFAASGTAMAQGGFDKPLNEARQPARPAEQSPVRSFISMSKLQGDERYDVEVRDGNVTAKVNGREVSGDRVRQDGDRIEILDQKGNVLASFVIGNLAAPIAPAPPAAAGRAARPAAPPAFPAPPADAPQPMEPPRVMIGITMSEAPPALMEHLELEPGSAVMVDRVIEELPAAEAGLRARDLIIEVDGTKPVTPTLIRETINRKEPGEAVQLKILRRGQPQVISIKLEPFDEKRFRGAIGGGGQIGKLQPQLQDRLRVEGFDPEQLQRWRGALIDRDREGRPQVGVLPEGFDLFVPLAPGDQRQTREKLTQLDERMLDLERQMERLAERMDQLRRTLERQRE